MVDLRDNYYVCVGDGDSERDVTSCGWNSADTNQSPITTKTMVKGAGRESLCTEYHCPICKSEAVEMEMEMFSLVGVDPRTVFQHSTN